MKFKSFTRNCIGRFNMYSKSTLKSFTKEELIDLLYIAEKKTLKHCQKHMSSQ